MALGLILCGTKTSFLNLSYALWFLILNTLILRTEMSLKIDLKLHNLPFTIYCVAIKNSNRELQGGSVSDFVRHKNFALEPALTLCLTCSCPIFFSSQRFCNTHSELVLQTCLLLFLPGELTRNATIRNKN